MRKSQWKGSTIYRAVEEILKLEDIAKGNGGNAAINNSSSQACGYQFGGNKSSQSNVQVTNGNNITPYEMIVGNSKLLTGYELNYLHDRGIMLYDSYVYDKKSIQHRTLTKHCRQRQTRMKSIG